MRDFSLALNGQDCKRVQTRTEHNFHRWLRRLDVISRWVPYRSGQDDRVAMARRVESIAADILSFRGHVVHLTTHTCPWDIWAGGAKVEVKAARWCVQRYQAAVRNHQADLLLLACVTKPGDLVWFVIPGRAVGQRRNLAIWSYNPSDYSGQWAKYLGAWDVADRIIERAGAYPGQLVLPYFEEVWHVH